MTERDPRFEREHSGSEWQIKAEMDRRLAGYFAAKHGMVWQWCGTCRVWGAAHNHQAVSNRLTILPSRMAASQRRTRRGRHL